MIELEWHEYDTTAEMADAVACDVAGVIESALEDSWRSVHRAARWNVANSGFRATRRCTHRMEQSDHHSHR